MVKYRLNKAEKVAVTINAVAKTKEIGGKSVVTYNNYIRLVPGIIYETDDMALIEYFKGYKRKVRYNAELEQALKANGVAYDVEFCKSCGGKIKKISYKVVEVLK